MHGPSCATILAGYHLVPASELLSRTWNKNSEPSGVPSGQEARHRNSASPYVTFNFHSCVRDLVASRALPWDAFWIPLPNSTPDSPIGNLVWNKLPTPLSSVVQHGPGLLNHWSLPCSIMNQLSYSQPPQRINYCSFNSKKSPIPIIPPEKSYDQHFSVVTTAS